MMKKGYLNNGFLASLRYPFSWFLKVDPLLALVYPGKGKGHNIDSMIPL
jgi:hypothetical protein